MLREGEVRYTSGTLPTKYTFTNSWQPQAEMTYDGLGNRLAMTGYADSQSVSTQYVLDQGKVLLATANSQTTAYLYGLGVIGSQTDAWSYLLPDGLNSSRQLADASGQITQAASYTPWGDTWAVNGASLAYGYLGGMMDTATGLIYVGNGQYYDPSTGRFLTRDANPDQTNPYVPRKSDPTSLLISPLALLALVYSGKRKRSKMDIVVVLMVVCGVLSLGLAGCGPTTPGGGTPGIVTPPPAELPGQPGTEYPSTPTPGGTPIGTPTYECTPTPQGLGEWEEFADVWIVSHYVTALERDPYFQVNGPYSDWEDKTGYIPGLSQNKKYNLNWIYSDRGVLFQGQGLSMDGEYITKDWIATTGSSKTVFKYGKGGLWGEPRPWATVATGDSRLKPHDLVKIEAYPDKGPFEVLDTGEQVGSSHLDVFVGDELISYADSLGMIYSKISVMHIP